MKVTWWMAYRYLRSGQRKRAVHFITGIAITGITLGTAALILVLSIFNGFQDLLEKMYGAIDPDIRIEAVQGKWIEDPLSLKHSLLSFPEIQTISSTLETQAAVRYKGRQHIAMLKGVDAEFPKLTTFTEAISKGSYQLDYNGHLGWAIPGLGLAHLLDLPLEERVQPLRIFVVDEKIKPGSPPESALLETAVFPSGFFSFQKEYDDGWILMDIQQVRDLTQQPVQVSAIELSLHAPNTPELFRQKLQTKLGSDFKVLSRYEIHEDIYRVMKNEKWAGYLILTLMLIIAGANIVGSLTVLVIEKQRDIGILRTAGATTAQIRNLFLSAGLMVGGGGIILGTSIAFIVGYTQMLWGWITIDGGENFALEAYPMRLEMMDFIYVALTVLVLSVLAAWFPAQKAAKFPLLFTLKR